MQNVTSHSHYVNGNDYANEVEVKRASYRPVLSCLVSLASL